jgi:hypothetical protein
VRFRPATGALFPEREPRGYTPERLSVNLHFQPDKPLDTRAPNVVILIDPTTRSSGKAQPISPASKFKVMLPKEGHWNEKA